MVISCFVFFKKMENIERKKNITTGEEQPRRLFLFDE